MIDLDGIREREEWMRMHSFEDGLAVYDDRRALLAYVDELREAAGRVTCKYCGGLGWIIPLYEDDREFEEAPCPDCAPLRALLNPSEPPQSGR